ncbi:hypothetical protein KPL70_027147 [Citrus sinensis]|nr:hypothetical protein KPL70_027147 [Citrus sinensis]
MQRYPGLNASQVIDSSSAANASLTLPTYTKLPNFYHGSSYSDLLISVIRSIDNAQPPSSDPDINRDSLFKSRQLPHDNPRGPSPSEIFSFSYLKERLLSRNTSVKELSKDVECEMSAGIAGVAKMIERLDGFGLGD